MCGKRTSLSNGIPQELARLVADDNLLRSRADLKLGQQSGSVLPGVIIFFSLRRGSTRLRRLHLRCVAIVADVVRVGVQRVE